MGTDFRTWGRIKIGLFKFFTNTLSAGYYRAFVQGVGLKGHERVLELGSGTGAASSHLASALQAGGELICVDISAPLQQEAKRVLRTYPNVVFRLGDATALGMPGESVDVIVIHFVLHDIQPEDREVTLRALRRLLKPDGWLVVREPIAASHGIPAAEIERLFRMTKYTMLESRVGKISIWRPPVFTGVFS